METEGASLSAWSTLSFAGKECPARGDDKQTLYDEELGRVQVFCFYNIECVMLPSSYTSCMLSSCGPQPVAEVTKRRVGPAFSAEIHNKVLERLKKSDEYDKVSRSLWVVVATTTQGELRTNGRRPISTDSRTSSYLRNNNNNRISGLGVLFI